MKLFLKNNKAGNMQLLTIYLSLLLLIFQPIQSTATHISGADLTYTWVSGNTFELELTLYRDCAGITAPNNVSINYRSVNCGYNLNVTVNRKPGTGQEITLPCNSAITTCNGGTSPGIQKYEYIGNVTLPAQCTDWVFSYSICCRNCAITTLTFNPPNCSGAPATYVEATLNNLNAPRNSSPIFSNLPVAFFCIGQPFHYNHGAYDTDGDSIVYSFIPPRSAAGANVSFTPPYSATNPISSSPPVSLSSTGDIVLNPTAMEVGVMAILVQEYRNGILIGSVIRDMQVYTQPCTNVLPAASGVNGTNNYSIVACPGKPLSFTILTEDSDISQVVTMDWNYGISGATLTSDNSIRPIATFNWTPTIAHARAQPYTFTISVIDNNCPSYGSQTFSYSVLVPSLTAIENTTNALCAGTATGSAAVIATGMGPFQYLWTPGNATTSAILGIQPGVYRVRVTDQFGCTATVSNSVSSPLPLTGSIISVSPASCNGGIDGSATVSAAGGTAPYFYSWNPHGGHSPTASGLAAGLYSVNIMDANHCSVDVSVNISEPPALLMNPATTPSTCGNSNGSANMSVSGGTFPYHYLWNPGGMTSASVTNLAAGAYQVDVLDANNCLSTSFLNITNTSGPVPQISTINNVTCFGGNDGAASLNTIGGTAPFTYTWSNGTTNSSSSSNLVAGTYSVLISDANNCQDSLSFTIPQPGNILLSGSSTPTSCFSGSDGQVTINVSGGIPPYSYSWSTGATAGSSISGLPSGSYTVTVSDQNACTKAQTITLNSPPPLTAVLTNSTMVRCHGDRDGSATIAASGGIAPYTYSWLPYGGNSETANGLDTGIYTVTIRDANNCIFILSTNISQPPPLGISNTTTPAGCGLSNGSANLTVTGGTRPLTYAWSTGLTNSPILSNVQSGSYQVIVTDAQNCVIASSIAISNTSGPTAQISIIADVSCHGGNDGLATVAVSSGTPPFLYLWSASGSTGSGTSNLSAGNHSVTITDSNNCVTAIPFTINEPATLTSHSTTNPATCYGRNDGTASVLVSGGTAPYDYSWSNGQNSQTIAQVPTGTYTMTCTDANGCITITDAIVTQPTALILHSISTPASCNGGQDGQGIAQCSGGTPGYAYSWSNGSGSTISSGLAAGSYTVQVTDAHGCTETNIVSISEPPALVINSSTLDATCFGTSNGSAAISVTGGTSPYTYHWSGTGSTAPSDSNLAPGNYSVLISDAHACSGQQQIHIGQPLQMLISSHSSDVSCFGSTNGTATVNCTGGTPPYYYTWNDGNTDSSSTQLSAGIYTVIISDQQGCTGTKSLIIHEPTPVSISVSTSTTICIGQTATLSAQGTGGTAPYNYYWQNGVNGQSQVVNPTLTGTYTAYAIDAKGCISDPDSVQVKVYPGILALTAGIDSICEGAVAQLSVNASGGNGGPYNYQWSSGSNQQYNSVQPQSTSIYTVSVNDNCGSPPAIATFTVVVNRNPDAQFIPDPLSGCVPLKVPFSSRSANQGLILHEWNFGDGNFSTEAKPVHIYQNPGQYTVSHLVINSNNCTSEIIIPQAVTVYPLPVAEFYLSPETASLQAPTITFENKSTNGSKHYWDFGDKGAASFMKDPEYTYSDTGSYIVMLITESSNGCLDTTYGTVRIKGEFALYIPNAFTPNGDGVNEGFAPLAIGAKDIKMTILDRWGIEIFHSTDVADSWNGTKEGTNNPCQMDVYVYIITASDLDGRQYRYTGRVSLIR